MPAIRGMFLAGIGDHRGVAEKETSAITYMIPPAAAEAVGVHRCRRSRTKEPGRAIQMRERGNRGQIKI